MAGEPTITCPKCGADIKLTESLAAPILKSARQEFAEQLRKSDEQIAERERKLKKEQQALAKGREQLEELVESRLKEERGAIAPFAVGLACVTGFLGLPFFAAGFATLVVADVFATFELLPLDFFDFVAIIILRYEHVPNVGTSRAPDHPARSQTIAHSVKEFKAILANLREISVSR